MEPISDFVTTRLAACHPRVLRWQSHAETRTILERWLRGYIEWLSDEASLANYCKHCPVDGAHSQDYGIRLVRLEGFGNLLAGIHFYGGNTRLPFVHVTATDFELSLESMGPLAEMLRKEFAVFRPQRFRIWIDSERDPLMQSPGAEVDNWFLAGCRDEIGQSEAPDHHSRITLVADPGLESHSEFESCYREFNEAHPGTSEWNSAVDREVLEECAREGGNFRVHVDGEPAGWIAARLKSEGLLHGWSIADELLEPPFRGRGLAVAMQRAFLEALPAGESVVWGTIDPRNAPSLATARRVGREIVSGYLFLPFS